MSEFKGTKEMNILGSNEIGFGIGLCRNNVKLSVWGNDEEAKANAVLISKAPEMLDMLKKHLGILYDIQMEDSGDNIYVKNLIFETKQLIKQATEL